MIHIAVVGSRDYPNLTKVRSFIQDLAFYPEKFGLENETIVIVSGGARGVDRAAVEEAEALRMNTMVIEADWEQYGKMAGFLRNTDIVKVADWVVAFWDQKSHGTRDTIEKCAGKGRPYTVVTPYDSGLVLEPSW